MTKLQRVAKLSSFRLRGVPRRVQRRDECRAILAPFLDALDRAMLYGTGKSEPRGLIPGLSPL